MLTSMVTRPRASLGRVIEDLGTTLLETVAGVGDLDGQIESVVIHDPLDEVSHFRSAIVLGVGLADPADVAAVLHESGAQGARALVVRAPAPDGPEVAAAVAESGVPLLALTRGASWAQLTAVLRALIAEDDIAEQPDSQTLGGMPAGDLFALADAIATLVDAPVTIEDRSARVLAFSGRQDEADPSRAETVLGRQVPEQWLRELEQRGVFRDLYRSTEPIRIAPVGDERLGNYPRTALAVRAGDEILGSIWVASPTELSEDRLVALKDSGKLVALHLLRLRAGADVERRLRADLLATVLEGGTGAADAAVRLRLQDQRSVVIALSTEVESDDDAPSHDARDVAERHRIADALAMHLGAVYQRSAVAPIGSRVYAVVGVKADHDDLDLRASRVVTDFLARLASTRPILVGIGNVVDDPQLLPSSRLGADRALRVVSQRASRGPVATITGVQVESLLVELGDVARARGDRMTGPVAVLVEHDRARGTHLVETLSAWLDAFGDVTAASARVFTHPNTFRYRLRRLGEISGLDLADPDARFAAMLQLRLLQAPDA